MRDLFDVRCIAEIVSRFDVIAIQEVRGNLTALQNLQAALGPNWATIMTDVTRGKAGNNERMVFAFDLRRARPSGLAGELVVAIETDTSVTLERPRPPVRAHALRGQLRGRPAPADARDPARPLRGRGRTVPTSCGRSPPGSRGWAKEERQWNQNLIALGDFNIDRRGDLLFDAFTSTGLQPAPQLNDVPRTIFGDPGDSKFYDQIAWFVDKKRGPVLGLQSGAAGSFDYVPLLQAGRTKTELSWKISDHYPLWVEFSVR